VNILRSNKHKKLSAESTDNSTLHWLQLSTRLLCTSRIDPTTLCLTRSHSICCVASQYLSHKSVG